MYGFFDLPRNWPTFLINNFLLIPAKAVIWLPTMSRNFILFAIANPDRSFVLICTQFWRVTELDCFAITTVNIINDIVFIFCSYSTFQFIKEFTQISTLKSLIYINDLAYGISFNTKLFADDTSRFSVIHDSAIMTFELNSDLARIKQGAFQWKMSFNPDLNKQANFF